MTRKVDVVSLVGQLQDTSSYRELNWEGNFQDYIDILSDDPRVTRTAYQRLYDMIVTYGTDEYIDSKKRVTHYRFFDDPDNNGEDAVYGLDIPLMKLVNVFKSAAMRYGTERRLILLHGPVGSSKSTIARLLKKGLERYSRTPDGRLFSFSWVEKDKEGRETLSPCPVHEEPLHLIPSEVRETFLSKINESLDGEQQIFVEGDLCPYCRRNFEELERKYDGDWTKVLSHIRVRRLLLSEKDRVGIGTFQPKDEKNQDSTELTGDINYRLIAEYGTESDPRAFNFDGEFNIANRGLIEFVEVLKLDVAFLYDLLGASQEHKIKPKKFAQTDIDEVILGHTNEPEYRKLQKNEYMEALRDRTVKIDIPYITKLTEEIKIYLKDYNPSQIRGKYIAPHTIEMAAMWAVLTRLEDPKKAELTLLQKLKLYDGKMLPGYTEDSVRELRKETTREGMDGISPRYHPGQDLQRPGQRRRPLHQPLHGSQRAGDRPQAPQPHRQRGETAALPASSWEWSRRSTRTSSRTRSSGRSPPTRTPLPACAATTSTTSRPIPRRNGCGTPTPGATRSRTSGSCGPSRRRSTSPRAGRTTSAARS